MNFKGTLTTLALAGSLTAGLAADPTPPTAPPTMPPAASTNSPEAILKNGSHAFGVWNANQWKSTYFFASDFDLGEVERGASETLQGKRPDGNTNVMTLKEAQEWLKEFVDLAVTNKMIKKQSFLLRIRKKRV